MDWAIEEAYKNGYQAGQKDAVRKGKWLINPDGYYPYCSCCGYEPKRSADGSDNRTAFCPGCGAELELEHIRPLPKEKIFVSDRKYYIELDCIRLIFEDEKLVGWYRP